VFGFVKEKLSRRAAEEEIRSEERGVGKDSAGPFRDVIISLLASLAQQERVRISERVRAGLTRAKQYGTRSGRAIARPAALFRRDQSLELREQGLSWRKIAQTVGVSATTVRRVCQGPMDGGQPQPNPSASFWQVLPRSADWANPLSWHRAEKSFTRIRPWINPPLSSVRRKEIPLKRREQTETSGSMLYLIAAIAKCR
jgi:hypothetical protein